MKYKCFRKLFATAYDNAMLVWTVITKILQWLLAWGTSASYKVNGSEQCEATMPHCKALVPYLQLVPSLFLNIVINIREGRQNEVKI